MKSAKVHLPPHIQHATSEITTKITMRGFQFNVDDMKQGVFEVYGNRGEDFPIERLFSPNDIAVIRNGGSIEEIS